MSKDVNIVFVIGNLTADPELRYTPNGNPVCNISLANNRDYSDKKIVNFFSVTIFGKQAENAAKYLLKGSKIGISGELRHERWEKDGKTQSKVSILCQEIQFLSKNKTEKSEDNEPISDSTKNPWDDHVPD